MNDHRRPSLSVESVVLAAIVTGSELRAIVGVAARAIIAQGVIVEAVVYATCHVVAEAIVHVIAQAVIHDSMQTVISHAIQGLEGRAGWLEVIKALVEDVCKAVLALDIERVESTSLHVLTWLVVSGHIRGLLHGKGTAVILLVIRDEWVVSIASEHRG